MFPLPLPLDPAFILSAARHGMLLAQSLHLLEQKVRMAEGIRH